MSLLQQFVANGIDIGTGVNTEGQQGISVEGFFIPSIIIVFGLLALGRYLSSRSNNKK